MMTRQLLMSLMLTSALTCALGCDKPPAPNAGVDGPRGAAGAAAVPGKMTQDQISGDQSREGFTRQKHFWVEATPLTNPIPFQSHFDLRLRVYDADPKKRQAPLSGVTIDQVDAVMPSHNHGMKVAPQIKETSAGEFLLQGMRFHMRGDDEDGLWVLQAIIRDERGTLDQTDFSYQCCR